MVTASNRPVWQAYEAIVPFKKDGKTQQCKRWCVGHIDGQYHRSFQMEEIARDFAKILNERDAALAKLGQSGVKAALTELKPGMKVRFLKRWGQGEHDSSAEGWSAPEVGQECKVSNKYNTYKGVQFWMVSCSGRGDGYIVRAEDVEAI